MSSVLNRLEPGDCFPPLRGLRAGGGTEFDVSDHVRGWWSIVLLYRGDWCAYCRTQLSSFQRRMAELERREVRVVAISADTKDDAEAMVERSRLSIPVLYGINPGRLAVSLGAYVSHDARGRYVNSTAFILDPRGRVALAVYSSGAVGRLIPDDAIKLIGALQQEPTPAS
jgi:peroxiredoxin